MRNTFTAILTALFFLAVAARFEAQGAKARQCPAPFPAAKFFIEPQPDSPLLIRGLSAQLGQNPNDPDAYRKIRVTYYFENRSSKKIKDYIWDNPMPDEDEFGGGGINAQGLLPGESHRSRNIFYTKKGPPVVFRVSEVEFADGTVWKAGRYNKAKGLQTTPVCVTYEKWPNEQPKRTLTAAGWSVPVFADRVTKTIPAETQVIDGIEIQSDLYEIKRERLDTIPICVPDPMLERIIGKDRDVDFDVEKYRSFSVKGRIFAYFIKYDWVDEAGQYEIGAGSSSYFVDEDGSGKFTLRCGEKDMKVPLWIKQLALTK